MHDEFTDTYSDDIIYLHEGRIALLTHLRNAVMHTSWNNQRGQFKQEEVDWIAARGFPTDTRQLNEEHWNEFRFICNRSSEPLRRNFSEGELEKSMMEFALFCSLTLRLGDRSR